jgi:hypothetical protein
VSEKRSILEDFLGEVCGHCGGTKRSKMSHCGKCYWRLPKPMRKALYNRFGEGYEQAFAESNKWLAEKYPRPPETGKLF